MNRCAVDNLHTEGDLYIEIFKKIIWNNERVEDMAVVYSVCT